MNAILLDVCQSNIKTKKIKKKLLEYQNHVSASMSKMAWLMRPPSKSSRLNLDSVKRIGPQKNDLMRGLKILTERMCVIKDAHRMYVTKNTQMGCSIILEDTHRTYVITPSAHISVL